MQYLVSSYLSLPKLPGVYLFLDQRNNVLYVGKAKQLKNRVSSYFANPALLTGKTRLLVEKVKKIKTILVESEIESLLLEANLIKKYSPKYNIRFVDGKAYPLIRITYKSQFPAVLIARRIEDKKSLYFGPFPNATAVREVLRIMRRIFPFQSTLNHPPRVCLYNHLGLCPCVSAFADKKTSCQPHARKLLVKDYRKTIRHIIDFLYGKTKKVVKDLEKERDLQSKKENYEDARKIQKQIDAIAYITQPIHAAFEYETNPNLRSDVRFIELVSLQTILSQHGIQISLPKRIECYDNSNIQGTNPTSSMVVFTNGEMDKSQYRKFKIKTVKGPNDFDTMQEVLIRRLKHTEWPYPDLIIVDGGKGQVTSALRVIQRHFGEPRIGVRGKLRDFRIPSKDQRDSGQARMTKEIPLIGLAKREETIITSSLQEIHLPKSVPALQLIMRIRDEAHRFAISFHRKLRSKEMLTSL